MSKRTRRDSPDVNGSDGYESPEDNEEKRRKTQKEAQSIGQTVRSVIRLLLARDLRGTLIRREHISQIVNNRGVGLQVVMDEVERTLKEVYGLTLEEVPVLEREGRRQTNSQKSPKHYVLLSSLSVNAKNALAEVDMQRLENKVVNGRNDDDALYFMPKYNTSNTATSNQDLVKTGVLVVVLYSVIGSENRIPEVELLNVLNKFGISGNVNERNSNINANYAEILQEFSRQEYLSKEVVKGATEADDTAYYSLGRRSTAEFPAESVYECTKTMYTMNTSSEDFESSKSRIISTIQRTYGEEALRATEEEAFRAPEDEVPT